MNRNSMVIVGGGLAGLVSSILLVRSGFAVTLIEKKHYPFHRVCGEYISNEVLPFLLSLGINIHESNPSTITKLAVSSPSGKLFKADLDLGGFGLSRYILDHILYQKALAEGVEFILGSKVNSINFQDDEFESELSDNRTIYSRFVIASYGKRSNLDKGRPFFYQRSPYVGVKYHIRTDYPDDLVQLDNFEGGYCGIVRIEDEKYCLCYLSQNKYLKRYGSVDLLEEHVLFKNPLLRSVFTNADFLFEKPEVINEISFQKKSLVENHVLFCGDAAGMISPLCGNGMAMAIHSAKVLCDALITFSYDRDLLEKVYQERWLKLFSKRLKAGRLTQKLFGSKLISELAVSGIKTIKPLSNLIMKRTHGTPF